MQRSPASPCKWPIYPLTDRRKINYALSRVLQLGLSVWDTPRSEAAHMTTRLQLWTVPLVGFLLAGPVGAGTFEVLRYDEPTISDIHAGFKAKTLTCRALVQMYLDRIEAYDKKGPALNAIVVVNPNALMLADALDAKFEQSGPVGSLHCVPVIVKDNYETTDMPTSAGSLSLKGVMSKTEAAGTRRFIGSHVTPGAKRPPAPSVLRQPDQSARKKA
jgi:hypothetical protein